MRSVFKHIPFLDTAYLISASFPAHRPDEPDLPCGIMQEPTWLNTAVKNSRLHAISHSQLYSPSNSSEDVKVWQRKVLPRSVHRI